MNERIIKRNGYEIETTFPEDPKEIGSSNSYRMTWKFTNDDGSWRSMNRPITLSFQSDVRDSSGKGYGYSYAPDMLARGFTVRMSASPINLPSTASANNADIKILRMYADMVHDAINEMEHFRAEVAEQADRQRMEFLKQEEYELQLEQQRKEKVYQEDTPFTKEQAIEAIEDIYRALREGDSYQGSKGLNALSRGESGIKYRIWGTKTHGGVRFKVNHVSYSKRDVIALLTQQCSYMKTMINLMG